MIARPLNEKTCQGCGQYWERCKNTFAMYQCACGIWNAHTSPPTLALPAKAVQP